MVRRAGWFTVPFLALVAAGLAYACLARPITLVVAVAPNSGSEPVQPQALRRQDGDGRGRLALPGADIAGSAGSLG
ncbi:hypothetical protein MBUL_04056 [Methylobacterium bullatum]|uniref:Uncharacterized protein n=1 Tax=Methylobacterium bullatum TaxID=570505 RepID=A0A679JEQ7_9HYPH|nr:hypothetical protein MBUL_04056 [Methylobacterium bullatum]